MLQIGLFGYYFFIIITGNDDDYDDEDDGYYDTWASIISTHRSNTR